MNLILDNQKIHEDVMTLSGHPAAKQRFTQGGIGSRLWMTIDMDH